MPRSPAIEQFTDKLRLTLDRLGWSRVQLAQSAGVDKSVAARWTSGLGPTGRTEHRSP